MDSSVMENALMLPKLLFLFSILASCSSYQIDEAKLSSLKNENSAILEIPLHSSDYFDGKMFFHDHWKVSLIVNDVKYYQYCNLKPEYLIHVPIPSGNVRLSFIIADYSNRISFHGRFENIINDVCPNEIIRIVPIQNNEDKITGGGSLADPAIIGCIYLFLEKEIIMKFDCKKELSVSK